MKLVVRTLWVTPPAEQDLIDVWVQIALDNPRAADKQLDRIQAALNQLAVFPESGPPRPEINAIARTLTIDRYLILYRLTPAIIEIIRVRPGMLDPENLLFLPLRED